MMRSQGGTQQMIMSVHDQDTGPIDDSNIRVSLSLQKNVNAGAQLNANAANEGVSPAKKPLGKDLGQGMYVNAHGIEGMKFKHVKTKSYANDHSSEHLDILAMPKKDY